MAKSDVTTLLNRSPSIGIAGYPEASDQDHELLRRAELAMYQAKEAGKG